MLVKYGGKHLQKGQKNTSQSPNSSARSLFCCNFLGVPFSICVRTGSDHRGTKNSLSLLFSTYSRTQSATAGRGEAGMPIVRVVAVLRSLEFFSPLVRIVTVDPAEGEGGRGERRGRNQSVPFNSIVPTVAALAPTTQRPFRRW